jgi:hypothetical protein
MERTERGQATVEWSALVMLVVVLVAGLGYALSRADSWRLGGGLLHSLVCAVGGDCEQSLDALERAYGEGTAALVRKYSPNVAYEAHSAELPIDFRRCRRLECSNGPNGAAEISRSSAGLRVTAFTRVVDRRSAGGPLYLQYWFYYPESFTGAIGRLLGPFEHDWPGYHPDDWEGYQVRIGPGRRVSARATAHGGYGAGWSNWTGWYRVSGGSHAGQLVRDASGARTTRASGLDLVPLEKLRGTGLLRFAVKPPWDKVVYSDPESASS